MRFEVLAPAVVRYDFPPNLAKEVLAALRGISDDRWIHSEVMVGENNNIRTSSEINFDAELPMLGLLVNNVFSKCLAHYSEAFHIHATNHDGFAALKYNASQKYDSHSDSDYTVYRVVTCLVALNPAEYVGGETYFTNFGLSFKPDVPSMVFFPSNYAYEHEASPIISGTKFVLVNWVSDLPEPIDSRIMGAIAASMKQM